MFSFVCFRFSCFVLSTDMIGDLASDIWGCLCSKLLSFWSFGWVSFWSFGWVWPILERHFKGRGTASASFKSAFEGPNFFQTWTPKTHLVTKNTVTDLFSRVLWTFSTPLLATSFPFLIAFFALLSPSRSALFCRAKSTAHSLERGSFRMHLFINFGKEFPSRNLRKKRFDTLNRVQEKQQHEYDQLERRSQDHLNVWVQMLPKHKLLGSLALTFKVRLSAFFASKYVFLLLNMAVEPALRRQKYGLWTDLSRR